MNKVKIMVGSMTYAIKLKKILSRAGLVSTQIKDLKKGGCVHGVEININDIYAAIALLKENNMSYTVENSKNGIY